MTVLPNFFERYTASLRILTSLLILKNGLNKKYLGNLSKIHTAEVFFTSNQRHSLDIKKFCLNILCAVSVIKLKNNKKFCFEVISKGDFLINSKIFMVFLINLSYECKQIKIISLKDKIVINFRGKYKKSLSALEKLKGYYFYCRKTKKGKIIIPTQKTSGKSVEFPSVWENIYDQFSPVNLYLKNIL